MLTISTVTKGAKDVMLHFIRNVTLYHKQKNGKRNLTDVRVKVFDC